MPPRYAYWTILIDEQPTAFRAREREELQPTLVQLQRKNANVTMRWFARGKLWESREAEQADFQQQKRAALEPRDRRAERAAGVERRGGDWRPGGAHKDPRDRFKKKNRPERGWSEKDPATQRDRDKPGYVAKKPWEGKPRGDRPWTDKPRGEGKPAWTGKPAEARRPGPSGPGEKKPWTPRPRDRRPWDNKPPVPNDRPWQTKPTGPRAQRKPWVPKPSGDRPWKAAAGAPRGDRPWRDTPAGGPPRERKPWTDKPAGGPPRERRPWDNKPAGGPPRGDRPPAPRTDFDARKREGGWKKPFERPQGDRPPISGKRPWSGKPPDRSGPPRGDRPAPAGGKRPWGSKPAGTGERKPWQDRPRDPNRKSFAPRDSGSGADRKFNPRAPRTDGRPPKRRDDE